jgi:hypothetical protein
VVTQSLERVIDRLHPFPLSQVGRVTLVDLLTHRLPVVDAIFAFRQAAAVVVVVIVEVDRVAACHQRRSGVV